MGGGSSLSLTLVPDSTSNPTDCLMCPGGAACVGMVAFAELANKVNVGPDTSGLDTAGPVEGNFRFLRPHLRHRVNGVGRFVVDFEDAARTAVAATDAAEVDLVNEQGNGSFKDGLDGGE